MAITQALCTSFKKELFEAIHDFNVAGNTFKMALYTSSADLGPSTTAYTATNEITGTNYVAGGATLTNIDPANSGTVGYIDFADVSWSSATFSGVRGALIYNDTAAGDPAVCVLDFGSDKSVSAGTFTVQFPVAGASTAIVRID